TGAQFVVGPLRKEAVNLVLQGGDIRVPTLVLNSVEEGPDAGALPATLFQIALSPEEEARQVAERIWFDGYVQAAVIGPEGNWGARVTSAFIERFVDLGGNVVAEQRFEAKAKDLSEPVKRLLNINQSEARFKTLRRLVGTDIKHEVRRRQDVDAIFMASFAGQARALRPQLRFHRASRVPVYATSHVYSGVPDADQDRDIDGVTFGDMPWILTPQSAESRLRIALDTHWTTAMRGYSRLFALGADAASLVERVATLRTQPQQSFEGQTGVLTVGEGNIVVRGLRWAKFTNGLPELLDTAVSMSSKPALSN
ncbi:MAG: penicillin-binding protein activator, partial [Chromatiales bacterium]|nr:penicillin-binding protein activator [Chromatiales bacterium]